MLGTELFVEMFFVLSGFVLWLPVAKAALDERTGRPGWVLLFRRMARLLPLYYAVVLVVWATTNPSLPGHWQDLLLHLTFTHVYSDDYIFWTDRPGLDAGRGVPLLRPDGALGAARPPAAYAAPAAAPVGSRSSRCCRPCWWSSVSRYLAWNILVAQPAHEDWSVWFSPLSRAADFGIGTGLAVLPPPASGSAAGRAEARSPCSA